MFKFPFHSIHQAAGLLSLFYLRAPHFSCLFVQTAPAKMIALDFMRCRRRAELNHHQLGRRGAPSERSLPGEEAEQHHKCNHLIALFSSIGGVIIKYILLAFYWLANRFLSQSSAQQLIQHAIEVHLLTIAHLLHSVLCSKHLLGHVL